MTTNKPLTTPCVGLCSTVFGDSVCRGCMRFVHEVIDWNRYNDEHKQLVWQRLDEQLWVILPQIVRIYDPRKIIAIVQHLHIAHDEHNIWRCVYDLIRANEKRHLTLDNCGFKLNNEWQLKDINEHLYLLATAYYQKDFLRAAGTASLNVKEEKNESGQLPLSL